VEIAVTTFEALYRDNLRLVYAVALSRVREAARAEDCAQETFLRAWRNQPRLRELAPPAQRAWLLTTVRNLAADFWRRQALETNSQAETKAPPAPQTELRLDVLQALSELAEGDRELVTMRYLGEMNSREIGEALGMPEGTVRRRLAQCRRALAQRLAQWAPEGVES
jgi:RNA polymerase sigma-70 factor (ECF subfamily)